MPVRDGVLLADTAIRASDLEFAAAEVRQDFPCPVDGVGLPIKVAARALRVASRHVPPARGIGLNDTSFWLSHNDQYDRRNGLRHPAFLGL